MQVLLISVLFVCFLFFKDAVAWCLSFVVEHRIFWT